MTRRRKAVLALVTMQTSLAFLGILFFVLDLPLLGAASMSGTALLITAAFVYVWRSLEMKNASAREELRAIASRTESKDQNAFDVGRAAGAEIQVDLPYDEQAEVLFGRRTRWYNSKDPFAPAPVAVLGSVDAFEGALPADWRIEAHLIPGQFEWQAEYGAFGLVLCDSSTFTTGLWRQAIDTSGEWLVQELLHLRDWANRTGALLVLFNHDDMPVGVNMETIRKAFHFEVMDGEPLIAPEGAPLPMALARLEEIQSALTNRLEGEIR